MFQFHDMGLADGMSHRLHPKSMDSLLELHQAEILEDLNSLGRYSRWEIHQHILHTVCSMQYMQCPSWLQTLYWFQRKGCWHVLSLQRKPWMPISSTNNYYFLVCRHDGAWSCWSHASCQQFWWHAVYFISHWSDDSNIFPTCVHRQ